jgi:hypothetical protein
VTKLWGTLFSQIKICVTKVKIKIKCIDKLFALELDKIDEKEKKKLIHISKKTVSETTYAVC